MQVREGYYSEKTRNDSYREMVLSGTSDTMARRVYLYITNNQPCSNDDIARGMNIRINCITGRVHELRQAGLVEPAGKSKSQWRRDVMLWRTKPQSAQLNLF